MITGKSCYFGNNSGSFYSFYLILVAIKVFIFIPSKLVKAGKVKNFLLEINKYYGFMKLVEILMAL